MIRQVLLVRLIISTVVFICLNFNFKLVVNKLCILVGLTIERCLGWWVESKWDLMVAFILGSICSFSGVFVVLGINR